MRPVLLLTRPREASDRFAAGLPAGVTDRVEVVIAPLIAIESLVQSLDLGDARGLVFSSAHAVGVVAAVTELRHLPCHCVGEATAAAARAAGWQARAAGATADDLVAALTADPPAAPLLHLAGRHRRGDIALRLGRAGIPTREIAVYDQPLCPLNAAARAALDGPAPVIAPLFSPRTARHFADIASGSAPLHVIGLSDAVLEPLKSGRFATVQKAARPDAAAMAGAISACLDRISRVEGRTTAQ